MSMKQRKTELLLAGWPAPAMPWTQMMTPTLGLE